jgi:hypothetical protein
VYGPSNPSLKLVLLNELRHVKYRFDIPWLLVGDFNIIRKHSDTNNTNINRGHMLEFNHVISKIDITKMPLSGRQFTYSNVILIPALSKLDRIFWSCHWVSTTLLPKLIDMSANTSDHAPLLLCITKERLKRTFKFEKNWRQYEKVHGLVEEEWSSVQPSNNISSTVTNKLGRVRNTLRNWAGNKFRNQNNCLQKSKLNYMCNCLIKHKNTDYHLLRRFNYVYVLRKISTD